MIKAFVSRKLLGVPYRFGEWCDEDGVPAREGESFVGFLDEHRAWAYILTQEEYDAVVDVLATLDGEK